MPFEIIQEREHSLVSRNILLSLGAIFSTCEDGTNNVPHQVMNNAHSCHITYSVKMVDLFRYVGAGYKKLLKLRAKQGNELHKYSSAPIFDIDVASDAVEIRPQMFCINCHC